MQVEIGRTYWLKSRVREDYQVKVISHGSLFEGEPTALVESLDKQMMPTVQTSRLYLKDVKNNKEATCYLRR